MEERRKALPTTEELRIWRDFMETTEAHRRLGRFAAGPHPLRRRDRQGRRRGHRRGQGRLPHPPGNPFNDIDESDRADVEATYTALVDALAPLGLAYLHQMEAPEIRDLTLHLRKQFPGTYILNPFTAPRPTGPEELQLIEDGTADLIAYGALFLAHPDLPSGWAPEVPSTPRTPPPSTAVTTPATPTTRPSADLRPSVLPVGPGPVDPAGGTRAGAHIFLF